MPREFEEIMRNYLDPNPDDAPGPDLAKGPGMDSVLASLGSILSALTRIRERTSAAGSGEPQGTQDRAEKKAGAQETIVSAMRSIAEVVTDISNAPSYSGKKSKKGDTSDAGDDAPDAGKAAQGEKAGASGKGKKKVKGGGGGARLSESHLPAEGSGGSDLEGSCAEVSRRRGSSRAPSGYESEESDRDLGDEDDSATTTRTGPANRDTTVVINITPRDVPVPASDLPSFGRGARAGRDEWTD